MIIAFWNADLGFQGDIHHPLCFQKSHTERWEDFVIGFEFLEMFFFIWFLQYTNTSFDLRFLLDDLVDQLIPRKIGKKPRIDGDGLGRCWPDAECGWYPVCRVRLISGMHSASWILGWWEPVPIRLNWLHSAHPLNRSGDGYGRTGTDVTLWWLFERLNFVCFLDVRDLRMFNVRNRLCLCRNKTLNAVGCSLDRGLRRE